MRVNVESAFIVGKAVARRMIARKRGKIINICSVQSELGRPTIAPYTATKGAIKMLTKGMCADWAKHGIQVNAIGPGYFKTPLNQALVDNPEFSSWLEKRTPAGRWGNVDELIGAAIFLSPAMPPPLSMDTSSMSMAASLRSSDMFTGAVVVMGVASCGKTTVGEALAQGLGWPFIEGDKLHSAANIAKMSAGIPLTDDDRWPWLEHR